MKKKQNNNDTRIGVWMDHRIAYLVHRNDEGEFIMESLESDLEPRARVRGEESNKTKWGPHRFSDNENTRNNKEINLIKTYYKTLQKMLAGFNHILITGPSTAAAEFHHHLQNVRSFSGKRILQDKSPVMSQRQLMAYMKKNLGKRMDILRPEEVV